MRFPPKPPPTDEAIALRNKGLLTGSLFGCAVIGLACAILVVAAIGLVAMVAPPLLFPRPDVPRLEAQGDRLSAQVEAYRRMHGDYPESLKAAGIKAPLTIYGRWRYDRTVDGSFAVTIGRYDRHGFTLWKYSGGEWYFDG